MAFTYGFYNSHDGDRTYSAKQFGSIFDGIINDGVFYFYGDVTEEKKQDEEYLDENFHFKPYAYSGMKIKVGPGRGWFKHTWVLNTTPYTITVPQSEVLLNRVDALVLEIDHRDDVRRTRLTVLKGPAENLEPTWPPTTVVKDWFNFWDTDEQKQIPIAYIRVLGKATTINGSDLFSVVGKDNYGGPAYVTGPLETVSANIIYAQIQDQWNEFFERAEYEFVDIDSKYSKFVKDVNNLYSQAFKQVDAIIDSLTGQFGSFLLECQKTFDEERKSYHKRFDDYLASLNHIFQDFMRKHNKGFNEFVELKDKEFEEKKKEWDLIHEDFYDGLREELTDYLRDQEEIWETWFQRIQGQLSDDAATNLQRQIDALSYCYVLGNRAILGIIASPVHNRAVFGPYAGVEGSVVTIAAPSAEPNYLND